jgi:hypothetical protein
MSEDRFIVGIGEGKFNVIAGHKLNAEPLTRAEADRPAHEPVKPAARKKESADPRFLSVPEAVRNDAAAPPIIMPAWSRVTLILDFAA